MTGKRFTIGCALAALAMAGGAQAQAPFSPPVVGGWSTVADAAHDAEVKTASRAAMPIRGHRHARIAEIERAEQQVVAGMNYRVQLRLTDRSRWQVTVYHDLAGQWHVTGRQRLDR